MKISIIDYGVGNLRSIVNAFENQGADVLITNDEEKILSADGLVLPGVGAFSHGMMGLKKHGLIKIIKQYVGTNKPFIGICLGMQMLFEMSEEFGETLGLGLIPGNVKRLPNTNNEKIPHVSWNELISEKIAWSNTILDCISPKSDMYFVHSYVAEPKNKDHILSTTQYAGYNFCSTVKSGNVYGCQFHPEKSGEVGLKIIKNFTMMCKND